MRQRCVRAAARRDQCDVSASRAVMTDLSPALAGWMRNAKDHQRCGAMDDEPKSASTQGKVTLGRNPPYLKMHVRPSYWPDISPPTTTF